MSIISDFIPKRRLISGITNAQIPTVTTTEDHEYNVGDTVRIIVPISFGMYINFLKTMIISVPTSNTFTMDLDTSLLGSFVVPAIPYTPAQVIPMAGQATDNIAV